jgi:pimeloyl-ACP methyl ester carboxylesterase
MNIWTSRRTLLGMLSGLPLALHASGAASMNLSSAAAPVAPGPVAPGPVAPAPVAPETVEIETAGGRISRVTHWRAPAGRGTIMFSHGALSSPLNYDALILPWLAQGYDVWAPLHVDSPQHPDTKSFPGLLTWRARIEDMRALSHHLGEIPRVAAGHSYGGLVALTLGGAAADVPEGLAGPLNDPRVTCVVAFSPPAPVKGLVSREGYATLAVPAFIETGTLDIPPGAPAGPDGWKGHLTAYDAAAPGGDRYGVVLDGVDHLFGGAICWLDRPGPPQTQQLKVASDLSCLFVKAYGGHDRAARALLDARLTTTGPVKLSRK